MVSQEGRFDTELTAAVVPDPGLVARGRSYQAFQSKQGARMTLKYPRRSVDDLGVSISPLNFDPEDLRKCDLSLETDEGGFARTFFVSELLPFGQPASSLVLASLSPSLSQPSRCLVVSCRPRLLLQHV